MLEYKLYQRDIKLEFKWNYRIQKTILKFRSIWRLVLSTESNTKYTYKKQKLERKNQKESYEEEKKLFLVMWIGLCTNKLKSI